MNNKSRNFEKFSFPTVENHQKGEKLNLNFIKEVLYNSLAQAIVKIVQTPHLFIKILLLMFVSTAIASASYMVLESIMSYFSFHVITISRTIFETPTFFPKVTVCTINKYASLYGYNFTTLALANENDLTSDEKKKLGHALSDVLISCRFNYKKCTAQNFTWSFDSKYGNCYTFNSGFDANGVTTDIEQSMLAGVNYGLKLELYVNYFEKLAYNLANIQLKGLGALIRVGNSSYLTDHGKDGFLVSGGFRTDLTINREFKTILPKPYSNCQVESNSNRNNFDSALYTLIARTDYLYNRQLCLVQCYQQRVFQVCNCSNPDFLSLFKEYATCNDSTCGSNVLYSTEFNELFNDKCLPLCPLECYHTFYKISSSSFKLVGYDYISAIKKNPNLSADFLQRPIDATTVRESIAKVNIFYDSLSFIESKESPQMDGVSLLGSIGGNLGLFLGVSLFSICELIEIVIEYFYIKLVLLK